MSVIKSQIEALDIESPTMSATGLQTYNFKKKHFRLCKLLGRSKCPVYECEYDVENQKYRMAVKMIDISRKDQLEKAKKEIAALSALRSECNIGRSKTRTLLKPYLLGADKFLLFFKIFFFLYF